MPTPSRTRGKNLEIIEKLGPLPLGHSTSETFKVLVSTFRAYQLGLPTEPPEDIAVFKLVSAGVAACRWGGKAAIDAKTKTGHPAAIENNRLLDKFWVFINGTSTLWLDGPETLTEEEFWRVRQFAHFGMEAYGLIAPNKIKLGREPRGWANLSVKGAIASRDRELKSGAITVARLIRDLAEQNALADKRNDARQRGRDPLGIHLEDVEAELVDKELKRLEAGYYRSSPITPAEITSIRRFQARLFWAFHNVPKTRE